MCNLGCNILHAPRVHISRNLRESALLCILVDCCDEEAITMTVCLILQGKTPLDLATSHDDSSLIYVLSKAVHQALS